VTAVVRVPVPGGVMVVDEAAGTVWWEAAQ
jgi:hypothetical protein